MKPPPPAVSGGGESEDRGLFNRQSRRQDNISDDGEDQDSSSDLNRGKRNEITARLRLVNSTVSGNSASIKDGGGIYNDKGALTLVNSTVSNNSAVQGGGIYSDGVTGLINTIVANAGAGGNCSGNFGSGRHNLDSDGTCGFSSPGDLTGLDPILGPLQNNGGPTETHALLSNSPAIDAGDDSVTGVPLFLTTDQRGSPRLRGLHVDIGAIEAASGGHFTVNTTADAVDANPGDGICDAGVGECTLRAAVMETNALPIAGTITLPPGIYVLTKPGTGEDQALTGDLDITSDLTITGSGPTESTIDGGGIDRVFQVHPGVSLNLSRLGVQNGLISGSEGGGIMNQGTVAIVSSSIIGNHTIRSSGGGGIFNLEGEVSLNRSTVANNTSTGKGGGILNFDGLALTNSTISSNTASNDGGGIFNSGTTTVTNSTISGNTADNGGGIASTSTAQILNTLIANNNLGPDCSGVVSSLGHNLDSDDSCGLTSSGDLPGTDPKLGPLSNIGLSTAVHSLLTGNPSIGLAGSPAIDAGDDSVAGAPLFISLDQRGEPRLLGQHVDIGAYEAPASGVAVIETEVPPAGTGVIPLDVLDYVFGGFFSPQNLSPLDALQAPLALGIPGQGLGAYHFELNYDPAVFLVLEVLGGNVPFDGVTAFNIDNSAGLVKWTHFQASDPVGPIGEINLANVAIEAVGAPGSCSRVGLTTVDLVNTNGEFVPNTEIDGQVCIATSAVASQTTSEPDSEAGETAPPSGINLVADVQGAAPDQLSGGATVAEYTATVKYDSSLAELNGCQFTVPVAEGSCTINLKVGQTLLEARVKTPVPIDSAPAFELVLPIRLLGSVNSTVSIELTVDDVQTVRSENIELEIPASQREFQRGDAQADGEISQEDAVLI